MSYTRLLFAISDNVAYVTLNRPEAANSLDLPMAHELQDAMQRCEEDRSVGAVVLTGAGPMFCGGGDLKTFFAQREGISSYVKEVTLSLHDAISTMARMNAPIIAAVNGVAAGGGLGLVCASDLAVASPSTRFTMAYTRAGLTPDAASTYNLPRLIGLRRALELTLTNRLLTAEEALAWGLVNQVVPEDQLTEVSRQLAVLLAGGATRTLGGAKRLLGSSWTETLETQMANERESIAAATLSPEAREGIAAFLEKRTPQFGPS